MHVIRVRTDHLLQHRIHIRILSSAAISHQAVMIQRADKRIDLGGRSMMTIRTDTLIDITQIDRIRDTLRLQVL